MGTLFRSFILGKITAIIALSSISFVTVQSARAEYVAQNSTEQGNVTTETVESSGNSNAENTSAADLMPTAFVETPPTEPTVVQDSIQNGDAAIETLESPTPNSYNAENTSAADSMSVIPVETPPTE